MACKLRLLAASFAVTSILLTLTARADVLTSERPSGWPQLRSDIPADPDIHFGRLPNGMRYLIKRNTTPAASVSMRLCIGAGSLLETSAQRGIAHFLEHMVFRGSKHFADGEAFKALETLGASRGADTNAFTYPDSTLFAFDLPRNDGASINTGLSLLRDIAGEATLDPKVIESERAVVLAELRQRDTVQMRTFLADLSGVLSPDLAQAMIPIGTANTVQKIEAIQLRRFYRKHYRPENSTLIIAGDIDPASVEGEIRRLFADWRNEKPVTAAPKPLLETAPAPRYRIFSDPAASAMIDLTWRGAYDASPDSVERERRDIVRLVGLTILNNRLRELSEGNKPPIVQVQAAHSQPSNLADLTGITALYVQGRAVDALRAIHEAQSAVLRDGVKQNEVEQAIGTLRARYQSFVTQANTMTNSQLASSYLVDIAANDVICSDSENSALFEGAVKDLNAQQVSESLRGLFQSRSLSVFVSSPTPIEGGESALSAALSAAPTEAINSAPADVTSVWPYTSFGPAGAVKAQTEVSDLGITNIRFANGVRAVIKPTKFRTGQILVSVRIGRGRLAFPKDRRVPAWAVGGTLVFGGTGRIGWQDILKVPAVWSVQSNLEDDAFVLFGTTRTENLGLQLQAFAAYLTDAGWRPEALEKVKAGVLNSLTQLAASPEGLYAVNLPFETHDEDVRWAPPTIESVQTVRLDDVRGVLQNAFDQGPIEVTIVGDVSVEQAIASIASSVGALPRHYSEPRPVDGDERFPAPRKQPVVITHRRNKEQAIAMIAWPTVGMYPNIREVHTLQLLQQVMSLRLFDELRTQLGMTYTPVLPSAASMSTGAYGYLGVAAEIRPQAIQTFYTAIANAIAKLKSDDVPSDELARARSPLIENLQHMQQTNEYWFSMLAGSQGDPRRLNVIRTAIPDIEKVTADDIRRAARTYLLDDKAWTFAIVPEGMPLPGTVP